jgi:N-acetylmuramoyl-L-alanine amidase
MRVTLDAGHGGSNTGCTNGSLTESMYTLEMVHDLGRLLVGQGMEVNATRVDDIDMSLRVRGTFATYFNSDFVVSLHVNSQAFTRFEEITLQDGSSKTIEVELNPKPKVLKGGSAFYNVGSTAGKAAAQAFAINLPAELQGNAKRIVECPGSKGHWTANARNVLAPYNCPAVLCELFFMSNQLDREFAYSRQGREELMQAVYAAIQAGFATIKTLS